MNNSMCKNVNEGISTNNLESSQKHIINPVYKNKVRDLINNAINNGDDISLDDEGNILCLQTKFYVRKYEWNSKIQDFVKVRSNIRKRKSLKDSSSVRNLEQPERVKELVEE